MTPFLRGTFPKMSPEVSRKLHRSDWPNSRWSMQPPSRSTRPKCWRCFSPLHRRQLSGRLTVGLGTGPSFVRHGETGVVVDRLPPGRQCAETDEDVRALAVFLDAIEQAQAMDRHRVRERAAEEFDSADRGLRHRGTTLGQPKSELVRRRASCTMEKGIANGLACPLIHWPSWAT